MSTTRPEPVDLVLELAESPVAEALAARLAGSREPDMRTPCARCGSRDGCGSRWRRPVGRPAAEVVAEALDRLPDEAPTRRPQVLRTFAQPAAGVRPAAVPPTELALRPDLTPGELSALLALDEPDVDARLFGHLALDDRERRRMLDGIRSDGSRGPVGTPLLDVLWTMDLARLRRMLPLAIESGDPGVASVIVGRLEPQTESGRLRPIVAVWTRHDAEAAGRLLASASYPAAHTEEIARALAAPDGLDVLRARLAELADPAYIVASLRRLAHDRQSWWIEHIAAEGGVFPWAELLRSHQEDPLPDALRNALTALPDCPKELLITRLRKGLPEEGKADPWLDAALEAGALSPHDLLRHVSPAASALTLLRAPEHHDRRARWHASTTSEPTGDLFRATLGTDLDAWVVAVRLVEQFPGSIVELLETSRAATTV
ncbi:hypothetical protein [Yinghuangia seranimata]|uniref:hypothetical protein n=1 Tax=Yinghuangia seranimata TaxID=408067 RepID=UPI00248CFFD0|nr:hypothetical protein [Yinghuangia seranimata]MDI2131569.1 hypothetical protein [Yinghuangia seranimata]